MATTTSAQREPMERLVRLATVLHHRGATGATTAELTRVAGFEGTKDATSALARELRHLRNQGWQIDNVGGTGEDGRYVMRPVDTRLRVRLTPAQQAALGRAALLADRADLSHRLGLAVDGVPPRLAAPVALEAPASPGTDAPRSALSLVLHGMRHSARLRFGYHGRERLVHPETVRSQHGSWYLGAREEGPDGDAGAQVKWFVVSRMVDVHADAPGSARPHPAPRHTELHPMTWLVDEPVEVTVRTTHEFAPDVRQLLGVPQSEQATGDDLDLTYRVTHRAALRLRLYQLGRRARLVGPDDVRAELLDELELMAGAW